jgi:ABC-type multidrug transport system fused ATPase/permease subunit
MDRGEVVESGTHQQLIAIKQHYFRLVSAQMRPNRGQGPDQGAA